MGLAKKHTSESSGHWGDDCNITNTHRNKSWLD